MIFIFGGAFNPPTKAHFEIANYILKQYQDAKLIFLPVGNVYNKANLIKDETRYKMLQLICDKFPGNVVVSDYEMKQHKFMGTINTLDYFQEKYEDDIYFVIGSDNMINMERWIEVERLLSTYKIVVLNRGEMDILRLIDNSLILKKYKSSFLILDGFEKIDISSSQYRMTKDQSLLTPEVAKFIQTHHLY